MITKSFRSTAYLVLAFLLCAVLYQCGEDSINAPQDFMSGTITYLDTNMNFNGGYYTVSIYGDSANPFSHNPVRTDSVAVNITNGVATAYYKVEGLPSASYYIGSTWKNSSSGSLILYGVYGCDENINCVNPTKVVFPNYAGTGGLSFKSSTH